MSSKLLTRRSGFLFVVALPAFVIMTDQPVSAARLQNADEAAVSEPNSPEAGEAPILHCERVWYRPQKNRGLTSWELSGVLTLSPDRLALTTPRETLTISVSSVQSVTIGRMGIDMSNSWAIVEYDRAGAIEVAGFTPRPFSRQPGCSLKQIAQAISGAVQSALQTAPSPPGSRSPVASGQEAALPGLPDMSSGEAPATSQQGLANTDELVVEEGLKEQITLSIPGGWSAHDQTKLLTGKPGPLGTVLYSPVKLVSSGEETGDTVSESLTKLSSGEIPSLQLDRIPAPKGTTCAGITPAAQRRILRMVGDQEPMFARGHTVVEPPRAEPAALTGVRGLRIRARSRNPKGVERALDLIALSDGTTLYLLYAQASADHFERSRGVLDRVLPTVQLTRCGARR